MLIDHIGRLALIDFQIVKLPLRYRGRAIIRFQTFLAWIVDKLKAIVIKRSQAVTLKANRRFPLRNLPLD